MWATIDPNEEQVLMNVALGGTPAGIYQGRFLQHHGEKKFLAKNQWAWKLDGVKLGEIDLTSGN